MAHQAESQFPAIPPTSAAASGRKRVILLCCEDLRFIACGAEEALRSRGWDVQVEYGRDARPWVQRAPVERPSVRILCLPGTVDRELADSLRNAFSPQPDADLHILGIDDARAGLVQEIERIAGARIPARRPLMAAPRLRHITMVEQQVRTDRSWRFGAAAAAAVFAVTIFAGPVLDEVTEPSTISSLPAASFTHGFTTPIDGSGSATDDGFEDPVLSAVSPQAHGYDPEERWEELPPLPEEEEDLIILEDDDYEPITDVTVTERKAQPRSIGAPALAEPTRSEALALEATDALDLTAITVTKTLELPAGFLPVAGLSVAKPDLPPGFMPVAGLAVTPGADPVDVHDLPRVITYSPFVPRYAGSGDDAPVTLHDPFVSVSSAATP